MNTFACTQCGCCCKQIGRIAPYLPLPLMTLLSPDDKGWCQFLCMDGDKYSCSIYMDRPLICRTGWAFREMYEQLGMSWESYCEMTVGACKLLQGI